MVLANSKGHPDVSGAPPFLPTTAAPSPLIVRTMPGFRPAGLALIAEAETPKVFACIARALQDLNKT